MKDFKIKMGAKVRITCSGEEGEVIGRAEYKDITVDDYRIRYKAADGRATTEWWPEDAIEIVE